MSDLFKGFEQLLELAKTLEEKIEKGEIKTDVQFSTRPLRSIPRSGGIPRSGNVSSDIGTSRPTQPPPSSSESSSTAKDSTAISLKDVGGLSQFPIR